MSDQATKNERFANVIKELSAQFLTEESNGTSLITITRASISRDRKKVTVFVSVMPKDKEKSALDFLKRQRTGLQEYLRKKMTRNNVPLVDIELDIGEANRQKIDELLRNN